MESCNIQTRRNFRGLRAAASLTVAAGGGSRAVRTAVTVVRCGAPAPLSRPARVRNGTSDQPALQEGGIVSAPSVFMDHVKYKEN